MPTPRPSVLRRTVSVAGACALLALLPFASRSATFGPDVNDKLTTILADLAQAVPQEQGPTLEERTGAETPLSREALPKSVQDALHGGHFRMNAGNEVQVYILMDEVSDVAVGQLVAEGVTIEITDPDHRRVQARVPARRLLAVAQLPFVHFIRQPTYAVHRAGAVNTEGDGILRSSPARGQFGLDGTGVKVGVISDGLKGVFATGCTSCGGVNGGPMASGDLPTATGTRNTSGVLTSSSGGIAGRSFQANSDLEGKPSGQCGFAGAGAEGTALLEIVHDIAPSAQLAFANVDTDLAMQQAVNYLAANNDVVMDDLGFYGDAYDGSSAISKNTAAALNNPANRIRTYVTANGNAADEHYIGTYADSGVDGTSINGITTSGHLHQFSSSADTVDVLNRGPQPYNLISMPRSGEVVIFLTWDDPFGGSGNNYDLYLVRDSTNAVVASSKSAQSGTQDPLEFIDYVDNVTTAGTTELFRIVVQNVNGGAQPKLLNVFSFQPQCAFDGPRLLAAGHHERHSYNTATRSVAAQNDAGGTPVSVISVGAICSASAQARAVFAGSSTPDESCMDSSNSTIEFFSSQGPTLDGRQKPDVSAIDGVSVTAAGSFANPFFGTSAAAPHVAGIAALILQAAPCLVSGAGGASDAVAARTALRSLIVSNAIPLGGPPNNTFGSGRVDALNSLQATVPALSGPAEVTVAGNTPSGATITASQVGFADPNTCALTKVSTSSGCSTSGSNITCPFGTTTAALSVSNGGVTSAVTNVSITVSNFAVAAQPKTLSIPAGQSATYQVIVSPGGGAFPSPVTLGCANLPLGAGCSFSPATITPGSGGAQGTVTISTTARASLGAPSSEGLRSHWLPGAAPAGMLACALASALAFGWTFTRSRRPAMLRGWPAVQRFPAGLSALAVAVIALAVGQPGCGSPSSQQPAPTPVVSLSPASLTFGAQNVSSTSAAQTVTLTNSGKSALAITGITASGDFAQTNTCGTSVAAGAACTIAVTFTPTAAGQRSGSVSIADNATGSPHAIALSGTGQSGPTPAGTYQVQINGTSGTLVQSTAVTLIVQ